MPKLVVTPLILAGGGGTRLWPLSRGHYPKQFLAVEAEYTLLQATLTTMASPLCALDVDLIRDVPVHRHRGFADLEHERRVPLEQAQPAGIGVGFGGPVDSGTGRICCSHQIEGWSEFPLGEWLRGLTGLPVRVDNDANTAALGEAPGGLRRGFGARLPGARKL